MYMVVVVVWEEMDSMKTWAVVGTARTENVDAKLGTAAIAVSNEALKLVAKLLPPPNVVCTPCPTLRLEAVIWSVILNIMPPSSVVVVVLKK